MNHKLHNIFFIDIRILQWPRQPRTKLSRTEFSKY